MKPAFVVLAVLLAACGSGPGGAEPTPAIGQTTLPAAPTPLLMINESGGCAMMGPNCATYVLWSDGHAYLYRDRFAPGPPQIPPDPTEAETDAVIDTDIADRMAAVIADTDFSALRTRLEPGQCWGCVDGIDYQLVVFTTGGPDVLSSVEVAFDTAEPFFAAVEEARLALGRALPLPIVTG